jgi:hypothetical protein
MIKRYDPIAQSIGWGEYVGNTIEGEDGEYVTYADHQKALQDVRRAALEEVKQIIEGERLHDHTGMPDDVAYNHAIDDCLRPIERMLLKMKSDGSSKDN